ncbi:MAG: PilN domain-containing protein [Nitrospiraceae bacterium]|nr:PilN domain-containing protein [Nitrospiraceae bacterium]
MAETIAIRKLTSLAAGSGQRAKRIGSSLLRVLTFSAADDLIFPQNNLSVSIERGGLSIAYGSRFLSGVSVRKTKEITLEEDRYPHPDETATSVALAVNEFGAPRSNLTLSIPKAWTIIKTAEFPATVKENLAAVVSYELDRLTPFTPGDAFFDFRLLSERDGKVVVLILAAKADVIQPYLSGLTERGITVGSLSVNLLGFGTLCRGMKNMAGTVFVKADDKEYEGAWFSGGTVTRVFSGSFQSSEPNVRADAVASEIKSLLDAAKTEGRSPGVAVYLRGTEPALPELLKVRIPAPLTFLRPADTGLKFLGDATKGTAFSAVGAMADSLQTRERGPNLLTGGVYKEQKPPVAVTVVLVVAIIAAFAAYLVAPLRVEEKRLAGISRQISATRDGVKKVEALKKEVDLLSAEIESIRKFKEGRPLDLNLLKELTTVLPKNTWLTRCRITETGVDIEGYAASATELLPKLEASPYFKKVEFASSTFRDVRMNADRFVIRMEIEGAKKLEEPAKKPGESAPVPAAGLKKTEGRGPKNEKK